MKTIAFQMQCAVTDVLYLLMSCSLKTISIFQDEAAKQIYRNEPQKKESVKKYVKKNHNDIDTNSKDVCHYHISYHN